MITVSVSEVTEASTFKTSPHGALRPAVSRAKTVSPAKTAKTARRRSEFAAPPQPASRQILARRFRENQEKSGSGRGGAELLALEHGSGSLVNPGILTYFE
jgi:hypothetical protein